MIEEFVENSNVPKDHKRIIIEMHNYLCDLMEHSEDFNGLDELCVSVINKMFAEMLAKSRKPSDDNYPQYFAIAFMMFLRGVLDYKIEICVENELSEKHNLETI